MASCHVTIGVHDIKPRARSSPRNKADSSESRDSEVRLPLPEALTCAAGKSNSSATAHGTLSGAYAVGDTAIATATGGLLNHALGFGDNSQASAGGDMNTALLVGVDSTGEAVDGDRNLA